MQKFGDGRHQINRTHLVFNDFARVDFRPRHDERHVQSRIVEENAVRHFPVFSEALSVIADDDDQRAAG